MKRIVVVSDLHCGHMAGLTPPGKFQTEDEQKQLWGRYTSIMDSLQPIDILVCNGDAIDGSGDRSGGTELVTTDRLAQIDIAEEVLGYPKAHEYFFTHGTAYHVGQDGEDLERILADKFNTEIDSQLFLSVSGLQFHFKHKIGGSSIPHGRFTALARQKLWNLFWSEFGETPHVDVFVRSHVHYFEFCGAFNWLAVVTPALQGWGTKYGKRVCEGTIDWGLVAFDVVDKDHWTWKPFVDRNIQRVNIVEK